MAIQNLNEYVFLLNDAKKFKIDQISKKLMESLLITKNEIFGTNKEIFSALSTDLFILKFNIKKLRKIRRKKIKIQHCLKIKLNSSKK